MRDDHWLYGDKKAIRKRKETERAKRKAKKLWDTYSRMYELLKAVDLNPPEDIAITNPELIDTPTKGVDHYYALINQMIPAFIEHYPSLTQVGVKGNIGWLLAENKGNGGTPIKYTKESIEAISKSGAPISATEARKMTWVMLKEMIVNGDELAEFKRRMDCLDDKAYVDAYLRLLAFMVPKPVEQQAAQIQIKIINESNDSSISIEPS